MGLLDKLLGRSKQAAGEQTGGSSPREEPAYQPPQSMAEEEHSESHEAAEEHTDGDSSAL